MSLDAYLMIYTISCQPQDSVLATCCRQLVAKAQHYNNNYVVLLVFMPATENMFSYNIGIQSAYKHFDTCFAAHFAVQFFKQAVH